MRGTPKLTRGPLSQPVGVARGPQRARRLQRIVRPRPGSLAGAQHERVGRDRRDDPPAATLTAAAGGGAMVGAAGAEMRS
jgi:hypothetical protein